MCVVEALLNDTAGKLVWSVWLPRELLSLTCYQRLHQHVVFKSVIFIVASYIIVYLNVTVAIYNLQYLGPVYMYTFS